MGACHGATARATEQGTGLGRDLGVDPVRKWTVRWAGPLRVAQSGEYRLWASGRGTVEVDIDGRAALRGAGDPLAAGARAGLTAGDHRMTVVLRRTGPGPRLRLGWTRPDGVDELIALASNVEGRRTVKQQRLHAIVKRHARLHVQDDRDGDRLGQVPRHAQAQEEAARSQPALASPITT